jgi:hypothetical protein
MALDNSIKVPLPGQGIIKYKSGGVVYAYYNVRFKMYKELLTSKFFLDNPYKYGPSKVISVLRNSIL